MENTEALLRAVFPPVSLEECLSNEVVCNLFDHFVRSKQRTTVAFVRQVRNFKALPKDQPDKVLEAARAIFKRFISSDSVPFLNARVANRTRQQYASRLFPTNERVDANAPHFRNLYDRPCTMALEMLKKEFFAPFQHSVDFRVWQVRDVLKCPRRQSVLVAFLRHRYAEEYAMLFYDVQAYKMQVHKLHHLQNRGQGRDKQTAREESFEASRLLCQQMQAITEYYLQPYSEFALRNMKLSESVMRSVHELISEAESSGILRSELFDLAVDAALEHIRCLVPDLKENIANYGSYLTHPYKTGVFGPTCLHLAAWRVFRGQLEAAAHSGGDSQLTEQKQPPAPSSPPPHSSTATATDCSPARISAMAGGFSGHGASALWFSRVSLALSGQPCSSSSSSGSSHRFRWARMLYARGRASGAARESPAGALRWAPARAFACGRPSCWCGQTGSGAPHNQGGQTALLVAGAVSRAAEGKDGDHTSKRRVRLRQVPRWPHQTHSAEQKQRSSRWSRVLGVPLGSWDSGIQGCGHDLAVVTGALLWRGCPAYDSSHPQENKALPDFITDSPFRRMGLSPVLRHVCDDLDAYLEVSGWRRACLDANLGAWTRLHFPQTSAVRRRHPTTASDDSRQRVGGAGAGAGDNASGAGGGLERKTGGTAFAGDQGTAKKNKKGRRVVRFGATEYSDEVQDKKKETETSEGEAPPPTRARSMSGSLLSLDVSQRTLAQRQHDIWRKQEQLVSEYHRKMRVGSKLVKYSSAGKPGKRWYRISEDGSELLWGRVNRKSTGVRKGLLAKNGARLLADAIAVRLGPTTLNFRKYVQSGKPPWLAFSIYFGDRTVDLVAQNDEDAKVWFLGLQALCPMSQSHLTRGAYLWHRARLRIEYCAMQELIKKRNEGKVLDRDAGGQQVADMLSQFVSQARVMAAKTPEVEKPSTGTRRKDGAGKKEKQQLEHSGDESKVNGM